ncbi:hypothetical protein [Castellaniella sp.]|uniref:hypothetical protein n=1 Tax=Castellaniella sp. TaxID=1955812 RepID=UPI002AFF1992|nr:hypothetical protein [Castellaniella sp.]
MDQTQSEPRKQSVVLVPLSGMKDFEVSLARLNKRAETFGLAPIKVLSTASRQYFWDKHETSRGTDAVLKRLRPGETPPWLDPVWLVNELTLEYPIIKLGDWEVVGQIESAADQGNLLFSVSQDADDVAALQTHAFCEINCEHCNTKRNRKLSYLLKDGQGNHKEVGSTCLEDFTGIDPAAVLFMQKMYLFWDEYGEDDDWGASPGRVSAYPTKGYLARVLFCMENFGGFVSSAKARDQGLMATYEAAASLDRDFKENDEIRNRFYADYERHSAYAQQIIDWWAQEPTEDSFGHNVKILLAQENIEIKSKHLAFAAAAVQSYQRYAAALNDRVSSVHVGAVGEKRDEPLRLRSVASWDSAFGMQWRFNFTDGQGNRLSWKTGSPPPSLREPQAIGRAFSARFKVKKHDEYKGIATTDVSHLKVDRWLDLDAQAQAESQVVVITIQPDTDAFADLGLRQELANIVRAVGEQVDRLPVDEIEVCDINGNAVGEVALGEPVGDLAADAVRLCLRPSAGGTVAQAAARMADALLAGDSGAEDEKGFVTGAVDFGQQVLAREHAHEDTAQVDASFQP